MYKLLLLVILTLVLMSCSTKNTEVSNPKVNQYSFLDEMYRDNYFPTHLVDKGKAILVKLCAAIEREKPQSTADVYVLTHLATLEFNRLANEFGSSGSEIETAARENIARDIGFILDAYNYQYDIEAAISVREW